MSLVPANAEARYQLGIWFYRRQLHPEAVPQFEQVVAQRPLDASAHDYLARSLEGLGDAERAERAYRSALQINEGLFRDPFFDDYYGRFLLKQDRLEESRPHLDRAEVYYLLATVYARPGETELARTPRRRRSPRRCVIAWSEGCTASRGSRSLVPRPLSPFQTYIPS